MNATPIDVPNPANLAVNITANTVTYTESIVGLVTVRKADGTMGQTMGPKTVRRSVKPGEVVDVAAYAHGRASSPNNHAEVPTVIEARTRGQVVPLWKPAAKAFREKAEAEQAVAKAQGAKREASLTLAAKAMREGLRQRKLTDGQVEIGMLAYGKTLAVGEDNETGYIQLDSGGDRLPLDKGLDALAKLILSQVKK